MTHTHTHTSPENVLRYGSDKRVRGASKLDFKMNVIFK